MTVLEKLLSQPKSRKIAIILALVGTILSLPVPIAGIHKFYLGQPLWGIIYLLLWQTPIPRIACAIDAVLYFIQDSEQFAHRFNLVGNSALSPTQLTAFEPTQIGVLSEALRELEQLRIDGLISEYEFEQKRRQLLNS